MPNYKCNKHIAQDVAITNSNATAYGIAKIFKEYITDANLLTSKNSYRSACAKLERVRYNLKDVSIFAALISPEYFSGTANYWTAGLFVSAAINKVIRDNDAAVLGFPNLGSLADCIGYELRQGKILFQGNVGDYVGETMSGGELVIQGNAGYYLGYNMSGGSIKVHGNAGNHLGRYMSGGEIHIDGQIGSVSDLCQGKIYQRDDMIR